MTDDVNYKVIMVDGDPCIYAGNLLIPKNKKKRKYKKFSIIKIREIDNDYKELMEELEKEFFAFSQFDSIKWIKSLDDLFKGDKNERQNSE